MQFWYLHHPALSNSLHLKPNFVKEANPVSSFVGPDQNLKNEKKIFKQKKKEKTNQTKTHRTHASMSFKLLNNACWVPRRKTMQNHSDIIPKSHV